MSIVMTMKETHCVSKLLTGSVYHISNKCYSYNTQCKYLKYVHKWSKRKKDSIYKADDRSNAAVMQLSAYVCLLKCYEKLRLRLLL